MDSDVNNSGIERAVQRFVEGIPQRIDSIRNSIDSGIWADAELFSHRLAGANLFGFPKTGQSAKKLEISIKNRQYGELTNLVTELITTIKEELAEKNKSVLF